MNVSKIFALMGLVAMMVFMVACSDDDSNPIEPSEFGSVSGAIAFTGAWPTIGDVQVSIWATWPPAGPPSAATDPIPAGSTTFNYKIEGLNKGTYKALTVGWRNPANPRGAKVLGLYVNDASKTGVLGVDATGQQTLETPTALLLSDANLNLTGLDMRADLAYAQ